MTIKKKIISGFLISATIIAILVLFVYLNFIEIKKEIRHLEFTDTVMSKSLQLRRHEKNFFLLSPPKSDHEWNEIKRYLKEISQILMENKEIDEDRVSRLKSSIDKYRGVFESIKEDVNKVSQDLKSAKGSKDYEKIRPIVMAAFLEQPLIVAEFLVKRKIFSRDEAVILRLQKLYSDIQTLRRCGEEIVLISKELDGLARKKVEDIISLSKITIPAFFLLFLLTGPGLLLVITASIFNRLKLLTLLVESTEKDKFKKLDLRDVSEEVGVLAKKFVQMEEELKKKNDELLRSEKLAALGTLTAGIAHELNNSLNNIYISAQVLKREAREFVSLPIVETINDIMKQAMRTKHIVSDLLEFAKDREIQKSEIDIRDIILGSYKFISTIRDTQQIDFNLDGPDDLVIVRVDPEQMERVFINLFSNAVDAMDGKGNLSVTVKREVNSVIIKVADTGKGIPPEFIEKIFEPFYSTKKSGTGLGLAIVYNIIRRHGGNISVESEEGKGTIFTIRLE